MSQLINYPLDKSGRSATNKVSGEERFIAKNSERVFIPTAGSYFAESLKVYAGTTLLTRNKDYFCESLNRNATMMTGFEVCDAIRITDATTTMFLLEYQAVGGRFQNQSEALANFLLNTPVGNVTELDYSAILNKPLVFPPAQHGHTATQWKGYTEFNLLTQEILAAIGDRKQDIYNVLSQYSIAKVSAIIEDYITQYGSVHVDKSTTVNGNDLFSGNGTAAAPMHLNIDALIRELDSRYTHNSANPLTVVGAATDLFLPISTGFFNVASPFVNDHTLQSVAHIEKNGTLLVLVPATDGSIIRYTYGYVKDWLKTNSIDNYQTTVSQYHPTSLATNEEIMDLFGVTDDTMLGTIYAIDGSGKATFKEHCLIELNGSLMQDVHTLTRLGDSLNTVLGSTYLTAINYRPNIVKIASGALYLFHLTDYTGELKVYQFNKSAGTFTQVTNWAGTKNTRQYTLTNNVRTLAKESVVSIETAANTIKPFHWLKSDATDTKDWIIEVIPADPGYTIKRNKFADDYRIIAIGNTIYCHMTFGEQFDLSDGTQIIDSTRQAVGASFEIKPSLSTPEYHWIRSQCSADAANVSDYVGASTGYIAMLGKTLSYRVPLDMAGVHADYNVYYKTSGMTLSDGNVLYWRPQSTTGAKYSLLQKYLGMSTLSPAEKFNGYLMQQAFLANNSVIKSIDRNKLNIANQTIVPVRVATHVIGDTQLIQTGRIIPDGSARTTDYYLYRPDVNIVAYPTLELGTILGYGTSDDRKLLASAVSPIPWVNSRDNDGNCRYSNMVFYRPKGGAFASTDTQIVNRTISIDYDNGVISKTDPYTLDNLGFQFIDNIAASYLGELYNPIVSTWGLYVSPETPSIGLLDFVAVNAEKTKYRRGQVGVTITWSGSNKLSAIVPNPAFTPSAMVISNVIDSVDPLDLMMGCQWAIQYDATKQSAHWHGRSIAQIREANLPLDTTPVLSFLMTTGTNGANIFNKYHTSEQLAGYSTVVTTDRGTGISYDYLACGVQRISLPFLNFKWSSGSVVSTDPSDAFTLYSARSASYNTVSINEDIPVLLGGTSSTIPASSILITDPSFGEVTDVKNKTIYVYVLLERGKPRLHFTDIPLTESVFIVYIGQYQSDDYGVRNGGVDLTTRIDLFRPSLDPRGGAFSVSSGTADQQLLLNWDADIPSTYVDPGNWNGGIDQTQYLNVNEGRVTFNTTTLQVNVFHDGKFFIKNKDLAIQHLGNFYVTEMSGGVKGARGYLNGVNIWKGKGTWHGKTNYNNLVKEGWNTVHMEWGDFTLQGPFLKVLT